MDDTVAQGARNLRTTGFMFCTIKKKDEILCQCQGLDLLDLNVFQFIMSTMFAMLVFNSIFRL